MSAPYQLLPRLAEDEYDALKASIAKEGYDPAHPIVVDEHGQVLDGHHRKMACDELGIDPPTVTRAGLTEGQKFEYALATNLHRRHLSPEQKRELVRAELRRDPDRSDRAIGRVVGVDHKTVGTLRRGEFPNATPAPLVTREEAERISKRIGDLWQEHQRQIFLALLKGFPAAEATAVVLSDWRKAEPRFDDEAARAIQRYWIDPHIDAILGWPYTGYYAEEACRVDDAVKAACLALREVVA